MAASTTSHHLVVCGGCNKAFEVKKWPIEVGADRTEGHCIKAMLSKSMGEVLQRRISLDEARFGVAASTTSDLVVVCGGCNKAFEV